MKGKSLLVWTKDDIVTIIHVAFSTFKVSLLTANHVHTVESSSLISISSFFKISVCTSYTIIISKQVKMKLIGRSI